MGAKVLLLEDDVSLACEMKAALTRAGCAVEVVRDGNAGLARAVSTRFDLIVASVELPGMNGFRLANRLMKDPRIQRPPMFLVSGQPSIDFDEHRKLPTRADSYFHKPIIMAELVARVRATLPGLGNQSIVPPADDVDRSGEEWAHVLDVLDDLASEDAVREKRASGIVGSAPPENAEPPRFEQQRARITEHEETQAKLLRELDEARAAAARAVSARNEAVARLEHEVAQWKDRALGAPLSAQNLPVAQAHDELALRAQLVRKDAKLSRMRDELDQAAHANRELREKTNRMEGDLAALKQSLADLGTQNAEMEKLLSSARADKEQATRRALDLSRRLERVRPDIEQVEQALAREQAERRRDAEESARALAEAAALREAEREEAESLRTGELAARDAAHARKIREIVSQHDSVTQPLQRESSELRAEVEALRAAAAQSEQAHREELLREAGVLRAEHIEAIAGAERAFEHKQAVLRHEFEAAQSKLREHAGQRIQEVQARLADQTRDARRRASEAEARFEATLAGERERILALERALAEERESRAEQLSAHAEDLAEASALRDRERIAAEERELALHEHLASTAAAKAREQADELRRAALERDAAVSALRRDLADLEARRKAETSAAESAREAALAAQRSLFESRIAELGAERDAAVERASAEGKDEIRRASEAFAAKEREHREARAVLEQAHRVEMAERERALDELREALQAERQARAADAAAHSGRLAEVARASNDELGQYMERFRAEQERENAELRQRLGNEYQDELARERQSYEGRIQALEEEIRQVRALKAELGLAEERWREDKNAELRAKLEELGAAHARDRSEAERRASDELAKARMVGEEAVRKADDEARARLYEVERERDARVHALEGAIAELERDRERQVRAADGHEATERALDQERRARASEAETHRAALASLARRHETELGEARQRASELETRGTATSDALLRERADHESAVADLQARLQETRGEAERSHAEAVATERRIREEAEANARATAAVHADTMAGAERRFEAQMADAVRQRDELRAGLDKLELRVRELETELERRVREARTALFERETAAAEAAARYELVIHEREREGAAQKAEHAREVAEAARLHRAAVVEIERGREATLETETRRARAEAKKEAEGQFENRVGRAMDELRTELELERAQTFAQMERTHSAALRRVMENGERERAALSTRVKELERLATSRSAEPAAREAGSDASAEIERFEALVRSRADDVSRLERELDFARAEVPALEAEIAALRTELTSKRLELDERALTTALARIDAADSSAGG
jgi:DNA-binding response OmpR family regulator